MVMVAPFFLNHGVVPICCSILKTQRQRRLVSKIGRSSQNFALFDPCKIQGKGLSELIRVNLGPNLLPGRRFAILARLRLNVTKIKEIKDRGKI